ncbi:molybdenum ABC transporter ATP-binding protein [Defluviimonas salinarum]|uniref:Molybdenum ABC transporter ATP-binding protein n=1 Tax=Defluviimonas salinarum TaxID=2992147 RepID=A0ABT3J0Q1_9RHOB|nr:molybdenum ABC transporter ATP-binding protein [Defluviimonas salinarum]MCW3781259.1 molybdenum ABC transporter ATP-binding protein [Defluviimonas salinarum]
MSDLYLKIDLQHPEFHLEIDRRIPLSGLTAIFGPSGAGKSTLLRIIAGFERGAGHVAFGDETWEDGRRFVPPHRRQIATVFQEPRLFGHLDVEANLAYAARRNGQTVAQPALIDRFDLGPLLRRRTEALSGGEAQRVALARALLTRPRLILMDEPLAALDHARRGEILPHIESLRDEARIPILYVSHSLSEVARLATQVLALDRGRVTGLGPAAEILAEAAVRPGFVGTEPGSLIVARVTGMTEDGLCELGFSGGTILTPEAMGSTGAPVRLFIRARDVMLARTRPEGLSALNILPARVEAVTPLDAAAAEVALDCGGTALRARITRRSVAALDIAPGTECHAILKTVALARD